VGKAIQDMATPGFCLWIAESDTELSEANGVEQPMTRGSIGQIAMVITLVLSGSYLSWGQFPPPENSGVNPSLPGETPSSKGHNPFPNGFNNPAGMGGNTSTTGGFGPNYTQVAAAGNDHLLMTTSLLADGRQQVVVTDTNAKTMAIYEVEPVTGKVLLRSVRDIKWDLQMEQFNATSPTPGEIRNMAAPR